MRKRRSKWWWVLALGVTALVWRWCRSSDEALDVMLHVKLARVTSEEWLSRLDDATVLDTEALFLREAAALRLIADHLSARREGRADADEPTGLLSHHAVQDEACWRFLDALLDHLSAHPAVRLLTAEACFA